jgi:hypothetical protein
VKLWRVILATFVIFTAGILAGAMVSRRHFRPPPCLPPPPESVGRNPTAAGSNHEPSRLIMPFNRPPGRGLGRDFLERLNKELRLEPGQRQRIQQILEESQKRNKEIWEKIAPEIREEMKRSREEIQRELTPEQKRRMEELMKRPAKTPREGPATNSAAQPPPERFSPPPAPAPAEPPAR